MKYEDYKSISIENIEDTLQDMECQPILFIGSGLSRRYFNAPNWEELLIQLAENNPLAKQYAYYKQTLKNNIDIGSELSSIYSEWAWSDNGKDDFNTDFFHQDYDSCIFIKSKISEILKSLTPSSVENIEDEFQNEIKLLQKIRPYAIVTTNYDQFLEIVFPEYKPIVGQQILRTQYTSIGEIFKIHGCVSNPNSIIFNRNDYNSFEKKKKYLSAKLLTYFLEHPVIFMGYNPNDPNIQSLLSDIDEILAANGNLVPNIYIINWEENINENLTYPSETLIQLEKEKSIRIKSITANKFDWILETLINNKSIENVNPKLLRALLSRTYKLIRTDIPKRTVEIDYSTLETALEDENDIAKIYGITSLADPGSVNIKYPFTLTDVARKLGFDYWHPANDLLNKIEAKHNLNIKRSDNKYHIKIKTGVSSTTNKYSQAFIDLLSDFNNGKEIKPIL